MKGYSGSTASNRGINWLTRILAKKAKDEKRKGVVK